MTKDEIERLSDIQNRLSKVLKKKRLIHSVGVEYTAASLAMAYGLNVYRACLAGILHDCAKYLDDDAQLRECKKNGIPVSDTEKEAPYLLHAKLGAFYAEKIYGVRDRDILSSIRWHTTGRPDMSLPEKIIFVADYIEPSRKDIPGLDAVRKAAFRDIDEAVFLELKGTLSFLNSSSGKESGAGDNLDVQTHAGSGADFESSVNGMKKDGTPSDITDSRGRKIDQNSLAAYEYYSRKING